VEGGYQIVFQQKENLSFKRNKKTTSKNIENSNNINSSPTNNLDPHPYGEFFFFPFFLFV